MHILPKGLCRQILRSSFLCISVKSLSPVNSRPVSNQLLCSTWWSAYQKLSAMATNADLERISARAKATEALLSNLQADVVAIRKAAVKQASKGEEERLAKENEALKKEVESLKRSLILAEVGNGVRQIHVPSKEVAATRAVNSTKAVNDGGLPKSDKSKKEATPAKPKEDTAAPPSNKKSKGEPKEKKGKSEGSGKSKNAGGGDGDKELSVDISRLEMRVGKIVAVEKHPDADSLYVEKVDVGEGEVRTIISGLVKHVPINAMKDRIAVFMCNLKPVKMRGILSEGMIMCATTPEKVEILVPPTSATIGDRVIVKEFPGEPDAMLNPKKKVWETLKPDVHTNKNRQACYKGKVFIIEGKGEVVAPTLTDTQIS